jgi:hypothetical protein
MAEGLCEPMHVTHLDTGDYTLALHTLHGSSTKYTVQIRVIRYAFDSQPG